MAPREDVNWLFARAVALYGVGRLAEAATLFRTVAAAGGNVAVKARLYLERIASELARTKRPARKRKVAKREKSTRKKRSAAKDKSRPKAKREVRHFGGGRGWGGARRGAGKHATRRRLTKDGEATAKMKIRRPAPKKKKSARPRSSIAPDIVSRIPHMDILPPPPLQPGSAFSVEIFVDQKKALEGEDSAKVEVPAGTRVQVHLIVSEHFVIDGPAVQPMTIDETSRSNSPRFHLGVKPIVKLPAEAASYISALFMHAGRPCGMVRRAVKIAGIPAPPLSPPTPLPSPVPPSPPPSSAIFEYAPAKDADLHITIAIGAENDGRKFTCIVQTPHLAAYRAPVTEAWNLPDVTEKLVYAFE